MTVEFTKTVKITDNSTEVLAALHDAVLRALERCGMKAEEYGNVAVCQSLCI